jgi:hypothetical protein
MDCALQSPKYVVEHVRTAALGLLEGARHADGVVHNRSLEIPRAVAKWKELDWHPALMEPVSTPDTIDGT